MASYEEARVRLTNKQLNKLKSTAKNNIGTALKLTKKSFQYEDLHHELFLTTSQKIKKCNSSANIISTDIKLNKSHLAKIIQSGGFLGKS